MKKPHFYSRCCQLRPTGKRMLFAFQQHSTVCCLAPLCCCAETTPPLSLPRPLPSPPPPFRYYLKGPKSGTHDIFVSNLPGIPDNICHSSRGNIWVPLASVRRGPVVDFLTRNAWARLLIAKVTGGCSVVMMVGMVGMMGMVVGMMGMMGMMMVDCPIFTTGLQVQCYANLVVPPWSMCHWMHCIL